MRFLSLRYYIDHSTLAALRDGEHEADPTRHHVDVIRLDVLLWALGGFECPRKSQPGVRKPWAPDRDALTELWCSGRPVAEIARRLGRTVGAVVMQAHLLDLPKRQGGRKVFFTEKPRTHQCQRRSRLTSPTTPGAVTRATDRSMSAWVSPS